ncbi:hypothetical protein [Metabacillus idriensis]|uniref:hypothetical protein n=1 Tax=Metabacillus idriensis TaxID=324768 RepID=UPI001748D259|nr:hypothetical protein [Metabacillus idriensis]
MDPLNFQLESFGSAGTELSNLIGSELAGSTAEFIDQIFIELTKLQSEMKQLSASRLTAIICWQPNTQILSTT